MIPCRAEHLGLCRLLAGVVGVRESLDPEEIADLKLVVTEACTCFLWSPDDDLEYKSPPPQQARPDSLRVDFEVSSELWQITVSDSDQRYLIPDGARCDPLSVGGLGLTIIKALADTVDHTQSETGGSVIRLSKRLEQPSSGMS